MTLPLTNSGHAFDFVSCGLRILSHKGRGKPAAFSVPQAGVELAARYLSPCGRGYEGRVSIANPWPKLVRGERQTRRMRCKDITP